MSKSNLMTVTFRVPSGGGGIVQGISYAEINKSLSQWVADYGESFTVTNNGYYRTLYFTNKSKFSLFLKTFRPEREHWWQNAKIEETLKLNQEIKALEKQFKKFAPISSALNYYIGKKKNLKKLNLKGVSCEN